MKIPCWIILLLAITTLSCSTTGHHIDFAPSSEYRLSISPNFQRQVFQVDLQSLSQRPLCIDFDQWPNEVGELSMGSQRAHVSADGATYAAIDRNFGYCMGPRCIIRIPPGEHLRGFISFSEFQGWNPGNHVAEAHLDFSVGPRYCSR